MKAVLQVFAEDTDLDFALIDLPHADIGKLLDARELFQMVKAKQPFVEELTLSNFSAWFFHFQVDEDGVDLLTERQSILLQENDFVVISDEEFTAAHIDLNDSDTLENEYCHITERGVYWTGWAGSSRAETFCVSWEKIVTWLCVPE